MIHTYKERIVWSITKSFYKKINCVLNFDSRISSYFENKIFLEEYVVQFEFQP